MISRRSTFAVTANSLVRVDFDLSLIGRIIGFLFVFAWPIATVSGTFASLNFPKERKERIDPTTHTTEHQQQEKKKKEYKQEPEA